MQVQVRQRNLLYAGVETEGGLSHNLRAPYKLSEPPVREYLLLRTNCLYSPLYHSATPYLSGRSAPQPANTETCHALSVRASCPTTCEHRDREYLLLRTNCLYSPLYHSATPYLSGRSAPQPANTETVSTAPYKLSVSVLPLYHSATPYLSGRTVPQPLRAPTCDQLECPDAPSFPHAHTVPIKSKYFFLDTVNYECDEGYYNVGSKPALVCNETAQWKYARKVTFPDCIVIECSRPPTIAHASWEGSSFEFNNSVVYTCDLGYEAATGSDVRTCDSSRTWLGEDLVCERVTCGDPPPMNHTIVTFNLVQATYTCDKGYNATSPSAVKLCSVYGNWTGPDLECTREIS
ncbi:sushi, von Willebrand factor type A, EGF and pentraxin domain-containing protein 1-like [Haliotis rubra]|uniref:sushi, von Willebrand factor type A, EGF and pentraxin domain-containing protein 1-like n=1 Tax=Haliotis rubra TaxID=36100 RepID=UPI001EE59621|nr:sushi, von Willebrand factor type A, EGF and pentraxin domain-containing protein 1-like [Haliotis rubra]